MRVSQCCSLGLSSCSSTDEPQTPQSPSESFERNISEDSKNIAELMASIPLTEDIVNEVFEATQAGLDNGIEESYY